MVLNNSHLWNKRNNSSMIYKRNNINVCYLWGMNFQILKSMFWDNINLTKKVSSIKT